MAEEAQGLIPVNRVQIEPKIGGLDTVQDYAALEFQNEEWAWSEWILSEGLHMTGAQICWDGWLFGDYGFVCTLNDAAKVVVPGALAVDDTEVTLTGYTTLLPYYDPAVVGSDVWIEFWDCTNGVRSSNPGLKERRKVDSVDMVNEKIVLAEPLEEAYTALKCLMFPCYGMFSTPRGAKNLNGGISLIGSGHDTFGSVMRQEATELIPQGMAVAVRTLGVDGGLLGNPKRYLSVNFLMRRPENTNPL